MAASQSTASIGASALSADNASNTPASASGSAGPTAVASSTSNAPSAASKSSSPQVSDEAAATVRQRDKETFNQIMVERFMTRDALHTAALQDSQESLQKVVKGSYDKIHDYKIIRQDPKHKFEFPPARLYGDGYRGFGNGVTELGGPSRILYPVQKPRPGKRTTPALRISRKEMKKQAEQHEELVPVRLDVDHDKIKLRDTFTFNLHERIIIPEYFATQLLEDMGIKAPLEKAVWEQVVTQLQDQLQDFYPFVFSEEDALDPELPYSAYKNDEMRILIKLNITIGTHTLIDQFEWDINNPLNSPEEFAAGMAQDLALSGEFTTAIAHCIREQAQLFTRTLYGVGHPFDGRPVEDPDLVNAFLPSPLPTVFRPQQQAKDYAPYLFENSEADLERSETTFSREQRRQKRSVNRRGGPQLPDLKERQRTFRTAIVSSVIPGAAQDIEESRLYKRATGTGIVGERRGGRRTLRDGDLSDSEDSEDSGPDSPAPSQAQGTLRTRTLAANAARGRPPMQLGRSETPEAATIHHHETRTARRLPRETTRDETEEPQQLVVTLKVPPAKLKRVLHGPKIKQSTPGPSGSATPSGQNHQRAVSATAPGSMGPPSTPSAVNQNLPNKAATPATVKAQIGRLPAPPPPPPGKQGPPPPAPPDWLTIALNDLQKEYPEDSFEGIMRYCALNAITGAAVPMPPSGAEIPQDVMFVYLPRIRCLDCPGKVYTPGPETTVDNFEVHLKNRQHREKVDKRVGRPTAKIEPRGQEGGATNGVAVAAAHAAAAKAAAQGGAVPGPAGANPSLGAS